MTGAYRRLLLATTVSGLGDGARMFAFLWLAASRTDDPRAVVLVLLAEQAPWLIAMLPAGVLVDRWDRRRIVCVSNAAAALLVGGFAAALAAHMTSVVLLASTGFLLSNARVMHCTAANALLPDLVGKDQLFRANARLAAGQTLTMSLAGPPLGALLCATAAPLAFAVDGASFAAAFVLLLTLPRGSRHVATAPPARWQEGVLAGVRHVLANRTLRALGLLLGLVNLVVGAWLAVAMMFAKDILHLDAAGSGRLASASGVGGILGAALAPRLVGRFGLRGTLSLLLASTAIALAIGGSTSTLAVSAVTLVVFAGSTMALGVVVLSHRQAVVPPDLQGRTQAAYNLIASTAFPAGMLAGGMVAHRLGLRAPILLGALLLLVGLGGVVTAAERASPRRPMSARPLAAAASVAAVTALLVGVAVTVSSRRTEARPPSPALVAVAPTTSAPPAHRAAPSRATRPSRSPAEASRAPRQPTLPAPSTRASVPATRAPSTATARQSSSRQPLPSRTAQPRPSPTLAPSTSPAPSPTPDPTNSPSPSPTPLPTATPTPSTTPVPTSSAPS